MQSAEYLIVKKKGKACLVTFFFILVPMKMDKLKAVLLLAFGFILTSMSNCYPIETEVINSGKFSGTIVEKGSQAPIEGVPIFIYADIPSGCFMCPGFDTLAGMAISNAQGEFTLEYDVFDYQNGYKLSYNIALEGDNFELSNKTYAYGLNNSKYTQFPFSKQEIDSLKNSGLHLELAPLLPFNIRVKNTNPYDSNDVFRARHFGGTFFIDSLIVHSGAANTHLWLVGDDIDVSIPIHAYKDSTLKFEYAIERNDSLNIDSLFFTPSLGNQELILNY